MDEQEYTSVYAIYPNRPATEVAIERLKDNGFSSSDISILMASQSAREPLIHENTTKAPEGAATGAVSGATLGGILGWLAGIGSLAIPGAGPLIAAGPIMAALAGIGIGGTVGGISGGLIGLGIPEYEARRYEGRVNEGGVLIAVDAFSAEEERLAKSILEQTGAEDISSRSDMRLRDDADDEADVANS